MTSATVTRVLVGVDFDEASAEALRMAAALARSWGAELSVFHAASDDVPAYFTASQIEQLEAEREQGHAAVAAQVRAFAERHAGRVVNVLIGGGPAPEAIRNLAPQFDLIVLGTHRRHGLPRWWLGSVAEAIVRHSPTPVLVVPVRAVVGEKPTILAAGTAPASDAWIEALRSAVGGDVVRAELHDCAPERLDRADVIVLPIPGAASRAQLADLAHVLKECRHPVLFVPSQPPVERTSS